jgi:nitrogenase-stabilizing/protective protein
MTVCTIEQNLEELESAEDFLNYFDISFDPHVVQVNRLHILQRFHNYLEQAENALSGNEETQHETYKRLLQKAYQDFSVSDALTEKVFKVFHTQGVREFVVPLDKILK